MKSFPGLNTELFEQLKQLQNTLSQIQDVAVMKKVVFLLKVHVNFLSTLIYVFGRGNFPLIYNQFHIFAKTPQLNLFLFFLFTIVLFQFLCVVLLGNAFTITSLVVFRRISTVVHMLFIQQAKGFSKFLAGRVNRKEVGSICNGW